MVNPRVAFVAAFENAVVRSWLRFVALSDRSLFFDHPEHRRRTGVGDVPDLTLALTGGFEDIDRAQDVYHRAQTRISLTGRHLQSGEMNNVGDARAINDRQQGVRLGDIAGHDFSPGDLFFVHDQAQALRVAALIKDDDPRAFGQQTLYDPRADETVRAGDQKSLAVQVASH